MCTKQRLLDLTKNTMPEWRNRSVDEWEEFVDETMRSFWPEWEWKLLAGSHKTPFDRLVKNGMVPLWIQDARAENEFDEAVVKAWLEDKDDSIDAEFDAMLIEELMQ